MPDSWLANYSSCTQLYQDIIEQINDRNIEYRAGENISNVNLLIKKDLLNLKRMLAKLKLDLQNSIKSHSYTRGELDRRQNLIDTLTTKVRNASETSDLGPTSPRSELHAIEREELFSTSAGTRKSSGSSGNPWLEKEERLAAIKTEHMRQQQALITTEQDKGVFSSLHPIKQRRMDVCINSESDVDLLVDEDKLTQNQAANKSRRNKEVGEPQKSGSTFQKILSHICCCQSC